MSVQSLNINRIAMGRHVFDSQKWFQYAAKYLLMCSEKRRAKLYKHQNVSGLRHKVLRAECGPRAACWTGLSSSHFVLTYYDLRDVIAG
jgi:hypothetical protein